LKSVPHIVSPRDTLFIRQVLIASYKAAAHVDNPTTFV